MSFIVDLSYYSYKWQKS